MNFLAHLSKESLLLCKYNNIVNPTQSQVVFHEEDKYVSPDLLEHMSSLNETGRLILEEMIRELSNYGIGYFSQETIARKTGKSRKSVNKYCGLFHLWGIITKQKRFKKTCLYKISDHLLYEEIIKMLTPLIGAFSELLQASVTGIRNLYYISTKYLNSKPNFDQIIFKDTLKEEEVWSPGTEFPIFCKKYYTHNQDKTQDCVQNPTKLKPEVEVWKYFEEDIPTLQKRDDEFDWYMKGGLCNQY